jgi:hypothetical protein
MTQRIAAFSILMLAVTCAAAEEPTPVPPMATDSLLTEVKQPGPRVTIDYQDGLTIRTTEESKVPFRMDVKLTNQFRYSNFSRTRDTYTDSTGAVLPISNRSDFQINRSYTALAGYALDPKLRYSTVIFGSTAAEATILLGWVNYAFDKAFDLHAGYWKVPAGREWNESFTDQLAADRSLATTFFRPSQSAGIWATGEALDGVHYVAMMGNAFDGGLLTGDRVGTFHAFTGNVWWEPLGAFGRGFGDLELHTTPVARVGNSFTYSTETRQPFNSGLAGNPENTRVRLSDGTPLTDPDALGLGTQVNQYNLYLYTADAGVKFQGVGLSAEYFLRWLQGFKADGPLNVRNLFDHGGTVQASAFAVPNKLELFARSSYATGQFGTGAEYTGGVNWYVNGTRNWKLTGDVSYIDRSNAENILAGYRAGSSGIFFKLQLLTVF